MLACKIIYSFSQSINISKILLIVIIFQGENIKDYLMKVFTAASRNILESYVSTKIQIKLDRSCLKQDKITFTHKQVVNAYIIYEVNLRSFTVAKEFALRNSLFRAYCLLKC